ncbi:hypothetical protein M406DRAFT_346110 [Cryphonectria parasitica EP155]|uniref:Myb-like DNA-binding domain-containing protein n=1 Tax=Cryphonectria parasitica (strain ATCC 38755 / EP155) TaxID=660469 RepID=A0A9P4Y3H8_CRYP1|nr:uncharacterized protein M406DRAFT_346110 [Cryphonectria parasitica EP155]KAF3765961.1 hypothetical protein M406DRAFT_346110 [Cryphonectria parasitica EP155]
MSPSNDNTMARFLFAILQQKCLKDIDWNKVARNPILTQEITNGHAARMRYSRFRQSILGIEPQRRNRNPKSKVTKPKKDNKTKKEKQESIKPESITTPDGACETYNDTLLQAKNEETFVKQEPQPIRHDGPLTPADLPPVSMADTQLQFHKRLMTPNSDTDLFAPAHGFATNPTADILHQETTFDYTGPAVGHCSHDQTSWQPSPSYSPFALPSYEVDNFSATAQFCEHQHVSHSEAFGIVPSAMMTPDTTHIPVKHEEWDTRFH